MSRLSVESCGAKRTASELWERYQRQFDFVCERRWGEMTATDDRAVRFCDGCKQKVHYCDTIMDARNHARQGRCVAVDLGITRHGDDPSPPLMMLGSPGPEFMAAERRRTSIAAVSQEREQRKQKAKTNTGSV